MPSPAPWISIKESPAFPKWQAVKVEYFATDDPCNNGGTNTYLRTEDLNGTYQRNVKVFQAWPDDRTSKQTTPIEQANTYCGQKYGADFFMSGDSSFDWAKGQVGPYSFYVEGASDIVQGLGLPLKRHVQYTIVFRLVDKPTPPPVGTKWVVTSQDEKHIALELVAS